MTFYAREKIDSGHSLNYASRSKTYANGKKGYKSKNSKRNIGIFLNSNWRIKTSHDLPIENFTRGIFRMRRMKFEAEKTKFRPVTVKCHS